MYSQLIVIMTIILIGVITSVQRQICVCLCAKNSSQKFARLFDTRLTYIGVIHHELSHAFLAILTGAKVLKISLAKKGTVHNGQLGSVTFAPRGPKIIRNIQCTLIQLGPILLGTAQLVGISSLFLYSYVKLQSWQAFILVVLVQQIVYHMQLSKADIETMTRGIIPQILVLYTVIYISGISIEANLAMVCIAIVLVQEVVNIQISYMAQKIF